MYSVCTKSFLIYLIGFKCCLFFTWHLFVSIYCGCGTVVWIMQLKTLQHGKHCSLQMLDRTYKGSNFCFAVVTGYLECYRCEKSTRCLSHNFTQKGFIGLCRMSAHHRKQRCFCRWCDFCMWNCNFFGGASRKPDASGHTLLLLTPTSVKSHFVLNCRICTSAFFPKSLRILRTQYLVGFMPDVIISLTWF